MFSTVIVTFLCSTMLFNVVQGAWAQLYVDIWRRRSIGTTWHWMVSSIVESLGTRLLIIHVLLTCDLFPLCPPPPLFLSFSSVPPLTVEGILKFLPGVDWRTLGERLIPGRVFAEIIRQHQSDDSRLRAVIECWLQGEGLYEEEPSWRRMIWILNSANETRAAADNIRHFAEPLPGKSCDSITFLYSVQVLPHIR